MGDDVFGPCQGLSSAEAARILGVQPNSVDRLVSRGVLPKAIKRQRRGLDLTDVETLALQRYIPAALVRHEPRGGPDPGRLPVTGEPARERRPSAVRRVPRAALLSPATDSGDRERPA